jgi:hypothetical protein
MTSMPIAGDVFSGGCRCGRVRYRATSTLRGGHFCQGAPAVFESSSAVERGFCLDCGTPLFFRYRGAAHFNQTVGSFDHPERLRPEAHEGIESRVPWHVIGDELARFSTGPRIPRLVAIEVFHAPVAS